MIIRVIDVETCGLPPDDCQIVEIATVDLVLNESPDAGWTRGRVWTSLVNPGRPIPPEASAVHHITDEMVATAPPLQAAQGQVLNGVSVEHLCAHEAKFEKACLPDTIASKIDLCTYKLAATIWPNAPNHKLQTMRYYLGLRFAAELPPPHRAMCDAYVCAALLRACLRHIDLQAALDISAKPVLLNRLRFGKHAMTPISDVPIDYLRWIVEQGNFDEDVMYTVRCELSERYEAQAAVPGYR